MSQPEPTAELIAFPCYFEFKAFGPGGDIAFIDSVQAAVSVFSPVSRDAMKVRNSSGNKYQCISVMVSLQNRKQLESIYEQLRTIDGLKYVL